ncbi:nucleoside diphosphate kinase-like [Liolophura sinensis]|uniref:nucleoside diphosphate kinase-like n=1 Tax=Liolophura sinensis TaxID=3198878 RepID=UPI003159307C
MVATLLGIFSAFSKEMAAQRERTFLMVKPDGVERGLVGEIITRLEKKGYKLVAMKFMKAPRSLLEKHYEEHKGRPFYDGLVTFIGSGPVVPMVWEGLDVVETSRKLIGATNPRASDPGTIRGDYGIDVGRNIIHGSDKVETAKREIALWFKEEEQTAWEPSLEKWIYE